MPLSHKYLLIIDDTPVDNNLIQYFAQFDFNIVQKNEFSALNRDEIPAALLIHWSFIDKEPEQLHRLYQLYPIPIIVFASAANETICVRMLEAGADDFLVKPLHPRELHARITAISRRIPSSLHENDQDNNVWVFANWRLHPSSRRLFDNNTQQELPLSVGEYELLFAFVQQPQQVLTRDFLLQFTRHNEMGPLNRRIDVQISRLRQKIEADAKKPKLIKTIRNGGYLFTAQVFVFKDK